MAEKKYDKLTARWSKKEKDILYSYPRSCDGHLLHNVIGNERHNVNGHMQNFGPQWWPSLIDELKARGYDITTLKFSIKLKEPPLAQPVQP